MNFRRRMCPITPCAIFKPWRFATAPAISTAAQTSTGSFHRDGFFVGGGAENNLDILGITVPGLFMKTEYRSAFYDRITLPQTLAPGASIVGIGSVTGPSGAALTFKPRTQTISTSLVYRFNWSGAPVMSKY
jgi:outer membrane immunogenic protein